MEIENNQDIANSTNQIGETVSKIKDVIRQDRVLQLQADMMNKF